MKEGIQKNERSKIEKREDRKMRRKKNERRKIEKCKKKDRKMKEERYML